MDVMTLAAKLTLNTSEFDSGLRGSESKMKGLTSGGVAWGNLISRMVEKAGKAMVNFGKQTVQVGMDFDSQMSQVKALGQLTDENFTKVRNKAMSLGESTKFTAAQVGEAFSYMALAGWDTEEMLAGIEGILNLAAASGEDLGRTSDIVTDALTAFGLEAKDTQHFVDVLAAASANSNTTVSQMGEAFKYVATMGGVMGYTIDDMAVGLGLLANNGIKSSQAGTSLRRILTSLIAPTEKAEGAMNDLGLSLFEAGTDKAKSFAQVMTELRTVFKESDFDLGGKDPEEVASELAEIEERFQGIFDAIENSETGLIEAFNANGYATSWNMDDALKAYEAEIREVTGANETFLSALNAIGGARGIGSLIAIMKTTDKDFEQLVNSVENSDGAAEQMSKTMLNNLQGDITILKSAIEGLQIVISDAFNEEFRGFIQLITTEVGKLNEAFKEGGFAGMISTLVTDVATGLTNWITNNTSEITSIIVTFIEIITENAPKLVGALVTIVSDPKLWAAVGEMLKNVLNIIATQVKELIFGTSTAEEKMNKNLFGGFSEETIDAGSAAIQRYIDAYNEYNKNIQLLDELLANGDMENYNKLGDQLDVDSKNLEKLYEEIKDITSGNGQNLFSSYMTWIYDHGYKVGDELPDFPVELVPHDEQLVAELDEGYSTVVQLIPDSSLMPSSSGDGSHAKGLWDVPYDNYTANLHRGEMVLTASQARRYRDGGNGNYSIANLEERIENAIRNGMANAKVNSYLNGQDITDDVSRNTVRELKARRFST